MNDFSHAPGHQRRCDSRTGTIVISRRSKTFRDRRRKMFNRERVPLRKGQENALSAERAGRVKEVQEARAGCVQLQDDGERPGDGNGSRRSLSIDRMLHKRLRCCFWLLRLPWFRHTSTIFVIRRTAARQTATWIFL